MAAGQATRMRMPQIRSKSLASRALPRNSAMAWRAPHLQPMKIVVMKALIGSTTFPKTLSRSARKPLPFPNRWVKAGTAPSESAEGMAAKKQENPTRRTEIPRCQPRVSTQKATTLSSMAIVEVSAETLSMA